MAFSDDAIGFYLQVEDEMSPVLKSAADNYAKFVGAIEKLNEKAYASASKGIAAVAHLVTSFRKLPPEAAKQYAKAADAMQKTAKKKPIMQEIGFKPGSAQQKGLTAAVKKGVLAALASATIRLTAAIPLAKVKPFDASQSLRSAYADMTQPPDMKGGFQGLPKFAKGGIVPGQGNEDNVMAMLTPGELVVPVDAVDSVLNALVAAQEFSDTAKQLSNIAKATGDPKLMKKANAALQSSVAELNNARKATTGLSMDMQTELVPSINEVAESINEMTDSGKEATGVFENLLSNVLGEERFRSISVAIKNITDELEQAQGQAAAAFGEMDGGRVASFSEATRELAVAWGASSEELSVFRDNMAKAAREYDLDNRLMAQSMLELKEQGLSTFEDLEAVAPAATVAAQAGLQGMSEALAEARTNLKFSQKEAALFAGQMVELNQQTGLGDEFISKFGNDLVAAFEDPTAQQRLAQLGVDFSQVSDAVKKGDVGPALDQLTNSLAAMGETEATRVLQDIMEVDAPTAALQKLSQNVGDVNIAMEKNRNAMMNAADPMMVMTDNANTGLSTWEKLSRTVGNFVTDVGGPVIEFFEEFNPLALVAWLHLGKMAISAVVATAKFFGLAASQAAVAASSTAMGTAGAAGGGGMAAMGAGLTALAPAIPVLLTLAVVAVAVGAALWMAAPAIEAFGNALIGLAKVVGGVLEAALKGIVEVFTIISKMSFSQMAGAAAGMYLMAPAFLALGSALLAFSLMAAASAPGLLLGAAAVATFGGALGVDVGTLLQPKFENNSTTSQEVNATVERSNELKQLVGLTAETNDILREMLSRMSTGEASERMKPAAGPARRVSQGTRDVSNGGA